MAMHFSRPVGATGQIGDGLMDCGRRGDDRARRRHAVQQPENFELRFELVGNAVDDEVGVADGVFNGGDEGDGGQRLRTQARRRIDSRA